MKNIKRLLVIASAMVAVAAGTASAGTYTFNYGWEDGSNALGYYGGGASANVSSPAYEGSKALQITKSSTTTPQIYIAWIEGIKQGDTITATVYAKSDTGDARIWGHYNKSNDINTYYGSANGIATYSTSDWAPLTYTWTVGDWNSTTGTFDGTTSGLGFVLEGRTYKSGQAGVNAYIDNLTLQVTTNQVITVHTPGYIQTAGAVPEPGSLLALASGLVGLVGAVSRRRK